MACVKQNEVSLLDFFFFKRKTAYERGISDWSSDVCSSDLNEYEGAVVIVSHDRHMLELTADRLVLVDGGAATEFKGSLDDYTAFVLSQGKAEKAGGGDKPAKINRKDERRLAAEVRSEERRVGKEGGRKCGSRGAPHQ